MDADFPAAHSMDTAWYAVDKDGYVAYFESGEGGAVPRAATQLDPEDLFAKLGRPYDPEVDDDWNDVLAELGFFVYSTADEMDQILGELYVRDEVPERPMHLDQLPPAVRAAVGAMCFEEIDFANTETFQPIEHTECETVYSAYLASDAKTVRPVPGLEEHYARYFDEYVRDISGSGLKLEEPPAPKPKRRSKKKWDD
jgi:hypothetical protein